MKTKKISVDPQIDHQIPGVLLDYLCELLQTEDAVGELILLPCKLGMGMAQDIFCKTMSGTVSRRVFGFAPVDAHLRVSVSEDQIELAIAG